MKTILCIPVMIVVFFMLSGCGLKSIQKDRSLAGGLAVNTRIILMESYKTEEVEIPSGLYHPVKQNEKTVFYQSIKRKVFVYTYDIPSGLFARNGGLAILENDKKPFLQYWYGGNLYKRGDEFADKAQYIFTGQNNKGELTVILKNIEKLNCEKFKRILSLDPQYAGLWIGNDEVFRKLGFNSSEHCF